MGNRITKHSTNSRKGYPGDDRGASRSNDRYSAHSRDARSNDYGAYSASRGNGKAYRSEYNVHAHPSSSRALVKSSRGGSYSRGAYDRRRPRRPRSRVILGIAIPVIILALIALGGYIYWYSIPISITVDGIERQAKRSTTIQNLIDNKFVASTSGNLIAVDNAIIKQFGGALPNITINGTGCNDFSTKVSENCVVVSSTGSDVMEDYSSTRTTVPYETVFKGKLSATLCVQTQAGTIGVSESRTGALSGKTVSVTISAPRNRIITGYFPDTGGKKIIALTFDDGPWPTTTKEILAILAQYNIKATFFQVGNLEEQYRDIAQAVASAGHEICTHTYDHAAGNGKGVNLGYMSDSEIIAEVQKGFAAIQSTTGETSTVLRAPGGNFGVREWNLLDGIITSEIGWDIDTRDWNTPGVNAIVQQIEKATAGDIILCHDGGGDRSQTVSALKIAIPYLIEHGFTFVTVSDLINQSTIPASAS